MLLVALGACQGDGRCTKSQELKKGGPKEPPWIKGKKYEMKTLTCYVKSNLYVKAEI
jgi:hypothetical protein